MGTCLTKDTRRSRDNESLSRISENTIFQPEEPYNNMAPSLAKPPQLPQSLQIRTFEQQTNRARQSLVNAQTQNKTIDEFLKNDSISVVIGSQIKSELNEKTEKVTADHKSKAHLQHMYQNDEQNCECSRQIKEKVFGVYSLDLGGSRQPNNFISQLTRSAINTS